MAVDEVANGGGWIRGSKTCEEQGKVAYEANVAQEAARMPADVSKAPCQPGLGKNRYHVGVELRARAPLPTRRTSMSPAQRARR